MKRESSLGVEKNDPDGNRHLARALFNAIPPKDAIPIIQEAFWELVASHNDEAANSMLATLSMAYSAVEVEPEGLKPAGEMDYDGAYKRAGKKVAQFVSDSYFKCPGVKGNYVSTLLKTKERMLSCIANTYLVADDAELGARYIRFFAELCTEKRCVGTQTPWSDEAASYVLDRQGAEWKVAERVLIQRFERGGFSPEWFSRLLKEQYLPREIQKLLYMGRARIGGMELAQQEMDREWLLAPFEPEKRSGSARSLFRTLGEQLKRLDEAREDFEKRLKKSSLYDDWADGTCPWLAVISTALAVAPKSGNEQWPTPRLNATLQTIYHYDRVGLERWRKELAPIVSAWRVQNWNIPVLVLVELVSLEKTVFGKLLFEGVPE